MFSQKVCIFRRNLQKIVQITENHRKIASGTVCQFFYPFILIYIFFFNINIEIKLTNCPRHPANGFPTSFEAASSCTHNLTQMSKKLSQKHIFLYLDYFLCKKNLKIVIKLSQNCMRITKLSQKIKRVCTTKLAIFTL